MSVKNYGFVDMEDAFGKWSWSPETNTWFVPYVNRNKLSDDERITYGTNFKRVHSLRAAKRHLRKHTEIPKGTMLRLWNRYGGCVYLIKK